MRYFFPIAASTHAVKVDLLLLYLLAVSVFFTVLIAGLILFFVIRYRRKPGPRKKQPSPAIRTPIEIAWIALPFGLCMMMFFWAASLYVEGAVIPADAEEVLVVGKQWMWKIQHASGAREIDELHVPLGKDVKLIMTSQDVIHSFYVPAFRVKMDVLPDRYTYMWFNATKTGTFHLYCAEYCGTQHSRMRGTVTVMEPAEYQRWLSLHGVAASPAVAGAELFDKFGCVSCHRSNDANRAPALENVYGSEVTTVDGQTVLADEEYLRESIAEPAAKVVAGYTPIMPSYKASLTDEQLMQLVQYVKSLGVRHDPP